MSAMARGIALLVLLLICLLALAPARLLGLVLPEEQVVMQGFRGTLWRGSAGRVLVQAGPGYLHLGAVEWRLKPWSLLLFAPHLVVDSKWGSQRLSGELVMHTEQDIDLFELEANVAAELLRQFLPVALTGNLSLQLAELKLRDRLPVAGHGRLVWQNGGWQSPLGLVLLGTYAMDFQQDSGAALTGEILTLSGPLRAIGAVQLGDAAYAVDIVVSGEDSLDPQLEQALSLIARPEAGSFHIKLDGAF